MRNGESDCSNTMLFIAGQLVLSTVCIIIRPRSEVRRWLIPRHNLNLSEVSASTRYHDTRSGAYATGRPTTSHIYRLAHCDPTPGEERYRCFRRIEDAVERVGRERRYSLEVDDLCYDRFIQMLTDHHRFDETIHDVYWMVNGYRASRTCLRSTIDNRQQWKTAMSYSLQQKGDLCFSIARRRTGSGQSIGAHIANKTSCCPAIGA